MLLLDNKSLKKYILENLSQEEIIAVFLGISEEDVSYCLANTSNKIKNPLRDDKKPSLGMMWVNDKTVNLPKIRLYDFADPFYRGDCFDLVTWVSKYNINNPHHFIQICKQIINYGNRVVSDSICKNNQIVIAKKATTISIQPRLWNAFDNTIWNKWGLTKDICAKELVYPVEYAWINNNVPNYSYSIKDPCYAYYIGTDPLTNNVLWQLYFPLRLRTLKNKPRFITNNTFSIMEQHPFEQKDILVLIKSKKDKMVANSLLTVLFNSQHHSKELDSFLLRGKFSYDLRALSAETPSITKKQNQILQKYYSYIFVYVDFDTAGKRTAYHYKREYGYQPLFLTNGKFGTTNYGAKDLSEYRAKFGEELSLKLMMAAILHIEATIINLESTF